MARPEVIRGDTLVDTLQTQGMTRKQAFASEGVWMGLVTTQPFMASGWHHHGDHFTYIYVASGRVRVESGPGGRDVLEAAPGDFVKVPAQTVHRESNPGAEEGVAVVLRLGSGPIVVNVDGPESA